LRQLITCRCIASSYSQAAPQQKKNCAATRCASQGKQTGIALPRGFFYFK
jgi:hypothetical protein